MIVAEPKKPTLKFSPINNKPFWTRHIDQIQEGGLPILCRKIKQLFIRTVMNYLPALVIVIVVRLIAPWKIIRFGPLASNRIGHFAVDTELYLCARDAGQDDKRTTDIFYHKPPISNQQLKLMWEKILCVRGWARWADWVNRKIPGGARHATPKRRNRDLYGHIASLPQHIDFTQEEEKRGLEALRALGIPQGVQYVCFHCRDSAYLESVFPDFDWSYHDYRDSSIFNYVPAAEEMVKRGYYAMRMGSAVKDQLNNPDSRIIDYANHGMRSDFLDMFLGARCRFFFCSATGISEIPRIFRRPIVFVNFIPLEDVHTWGLDDLFIPKRLWLRQERRFMKFREIMESGAGLFYFSKEYKQRDIEPVENTAEEIRSVVVEMEERLDRRWQTTQEDDQLQRRFWDLFKNSKMHGKIVTRIGAEFLRQNKDLLE